MWWEESTETTHGVIRMTRNSSKMQGFKHSEVHFGIGRQAHVSVFVNSHAETGSLVSSRTSHRLPMVPPPTQPLNLMVNIYGGTQLPYVFQRDWQSNPCAKPSLGNPLCCTYRCLGPVFWTEVGCVKIDVFGIGTIDLSFIKAKKISTINLPCCLKKK